MKSFNHTATKIKNQLLNSLIPSIEQVSTEGKEKRKHFETG